MANHPLWQDEYWLLLLQLYLKKPIGLKPVYSKLLVNLSIELHIPPQYLYEQMARLRSLDTPRLERLWAQYGNSPRKLSRGVKLLRQRMGFHNANEFFEGVEINETFEKDFRPIQLNEDADKTEKQLCPIHLILILDLYFRLTPITMVEETPEIQELAKLMKVPATMIVNIMDIYQFCDPYRTRAQMVISPLNNPCMEIWERYGNGNIQKLAAYAHQLKDYFK